jgi:hypothetical protein
VVEVSNEDVAAPASAPCNDADDLGVGGDVGAGVEGADDAEELTLVRCSFSSALKQLRLCHFRARGCYQIARLPSAHSAAGDRVHGWCSRMLSDRALAVA